MKHLDEYRDATLGRRLIARIDALVAAARAKLERAPDQPLRIMEVCGGHTHTIFKYALERALPSGLTLVHGPGCPVCVLPIGRIDQSIAVAQRPGVTLCTFGDALRVPGSRQSLLQAQAAGADVRTVYSPADALAIARRLPEREVVFLAVGFETTAPSSALVVREARRERVRNFSVLSNHITIMPALRALLDAGEQRLDGFIGPGHVSMVIGSDAYAEIPARYGVPLVVSGFEPLDLLQSIALLLAQLASGQARVENQYARVVHARGNLAAQRALDEVFELRDTFEWRGLGSIPRSGLRLRSSYADFDAEQRFRVRSPAVADPKACRCGEVLRGVIAPWQCRVFGSGCTPEAPLGACMVSSEGACAAYFDYRRLQRRSAQP